MLGLRITRGYSVDKLGHRARLGIRRYIVGVDRRTDYLVFLAPRIRSASFFFCASSSLSMFFFQA
jgi:hypothetical protein